MRDSSSPKKGLSKKRKKKAEFSPDTHPFQILGASTSSVPKAPIMGLGRRTSPHRTNSSPPSGPRFGGGEYREIHERERERGREPYRDRERDRSRSPTRSNDRYSRSDRPERYDSDTAKYPSTWNNYRPIYSERDNPVPADLRRKYYAAWATIPERHFCHELNLEPQQKLD